MLGFNSSLICTWEVLLGYIGFVATDGGRGGLFWGFTVCMFGFAAVYASIAEMASM